VRSADVIIAGAGIIGISIALELRAWGADVLVLDRGTPGREASSAAAGMLAAADPETPGPLRPLAVESARLYPAFVKSIETASDMRVDFRRQGTIAVGEHLEGTSGHRRLSSEEVHHLEPGIVTGHSAFLVAEDSVDPALLIEAALAAAARAGVEIRDGVNVRELRSVAGGVHVVTASGQFTAKAAVNCCGAWSGPPVKPRKGQMLYLQPNRPGILEHVLRAPDVYIVPRSSGKILVGATVEDVGFDKSVENETIVRLQQNACKYLPELETAALVNSWAGLRPGTADDLPLIGPTEQPHVFIASGHFRNGILLAPVTGKIVADLIIGKTSPVDISAFSPQRFTLANANPS
jgi:glycine oxidase